VQTNFPPAAPADLQRYAAAFVQLDTDRDGLVKGADCIDLFMRWGLPQSVLRDAWALVAGGAGHLSQEQFVRCLYVLQSAKGGMPLPAALPPGPFPPVAGAAGGLASPDVQQFERLFAFGRYKEAAECAARAPGRLLRTCEVMARLRAAPSPAGQHPPLLIMFMCVMQSGRLDAQESAELARRAALAVTASAAAHHSFLSTSALCLLKPHETKTFPKPQARHPSGQVRAARGVVGGRQAARLRGTGRPDGVRRRP